MRVKIFKHAHEQPASLDTCRAASGPSFGHKSRIHEWCTHVHQSQPHIKGIRTNDEMMEETTLSSSLRNRKRLFGYKPSQLGPLEYVVLHTLVPSNGFLSFSSMYSWLLLAAEQLESSWSQIHPPICIRLLLATWAYEVAGLGVLFGFPGQAFRLLNVFRDFCSGSEFSCHQPWKQMQRESEA